MGQMAHRAIDHGALRGKLRPAWAIWPKSASPIAFLLLNLPCRGPNGPERDQSRGIEGQTASCVGHLAHKCVANCAENQKTCVSIAKLASLFSKFSSETVKIDSIQHIAES